jgi:hypothetical protein
LGETSNNSSPFFKAMLWFLGIGFALLLIGCIGAYYVAYKMMNPPPSHFQDLDRLSDETKGMAGLYLSEPIDHVYIYKEHRFFGNTYLRYHFLQAADFEKHRKSEERKPPAEKYNTVTWDLAVDVPEAIRPWWVRKNQPDCELFGTMDCYKIYDAANHIVYVFRSGG